MDQAHRISPLVLALTCTEREPPPCGRGGIEHSNFCSYLSHNDESTATSIRGYVAARQKNGCAPIKVIYIDKPGCDGLTVCGAYRPVRQLNRFK